MCAGSTIALRLAQQRRLCLRPQVLQHIELGVQGLGPESSRRFGQPPEPFAPPLGVVHAPSRGLATTGVSRSCSHWACVPSSSATCTGPRMPRKNAGIAVASVGTTLRPIIRPFSSSTAATVVACCTSRPTYFGVRFMRAALCCGPWGVDTSMVAARGVLSISVMLCPSLSCALPIRETVRCAN